MKMKSKIFGLGAKLALAFLAVGTMTSCYDSENGDVTKPYVAPDPVYKVGGTITDVETGAALNATVKVNGSAVTVTDGVYLADAVAGSNTVVVSMAGYNNDEAVERTVNIATVAAGQSATAVVNVALLKNQEETPEFDLSKVTMEVANIKSGEYTNEFTVVDYPEMEAIAYDEELVVDWTFEDIQIGASIEPTVEEALADAPAEAKAGLIAYAKSVIGVYEGIYGEQRGIDETYKVSIAPYHELKSVTITYNGTKVSYTFGYDGWTGEAIVITGLNSYKFSNTQEAFTHDHTHGHCDTTHGHGHGHGGNLNAGGGIFDGNF